MAKSVSVRVPRLTKPMAGACPGVAPGGYSARNMETDTRPLGTPANGAVRTTSPVAAAASAAPRRAGLEQTSNPSLPGAPPGPTTTLAIGQ